MSKDERRYQVSIRLTREEWLDAHEAAVFTDNSISQMARYGIRQYVKIAVDNGMLLDHSEGVEERWR